MGGWAITVSLRCTTEALRMIATAFWPILCFDSSKLNPRYKEWMQECLAHLHDVPVIQQVSNRVAFTAPFINTISLPMS
jgi:hypothetical protein